ncbi:MULTISPECIES: hypothetical protein [Hyphomicrobiales]|jgi:hypothetical protein|uniref:hypothetical protein n=1 Tax=Hyphomicrobiales TaxID=356 RepID=UPI000769A450|nr:MULTISPECIES: hypothetical protein [Hyphomicrobiales]OJY70778.1 MAG: hypothetical protein BGP09_32685 [Rhizobium sp. 60-20]TXG96461.1 MAG: hypothetical protein E6R08_09560 [Nevskiaceae bacterium]
MTAHNLPISIHTSLALRKTLGGHADRVPALALREVLKNGKSLEIACQQFSFRSQPVVFSSRITAGGSLVIDLDLGDARLAGRVLLEDDLRKASRPSAGRSAASSGRR